MSSQSNTQESIDVNGVTTSPEINVGDVVYLNGENWLLTFDDIDAMNLASDTWVFRANRGDVIWIRPDTPLLVLASRKTGVASESRVYYVMPYGVMCLGWICGHEVRRSR